MPYLVVLESRGDPDARLYLCTPDHPPHTGDLRASRVWHRLTTPDPDRATAFNIFEREFADLTVHHLKQNDVTARVVYHPVKPVRWLRSVLGR